MKVIRPSLIPWLSLLVCIGIPPARSAPNELPVPLAMLPELKVPDGKLTLITAPGEAGTAKLFLTNTTEKEVAGAIFGVGQRFKEVWIGGHCRRCWSFEPGK